MRNMRATLLIMVTLLFGWFVHIEQSDATDSKKTGKTTRAETSLAPKKTHPSQPVAAPEKPAISSTEAQPLPDLTVTKIGLDRECRIVIDIKNSGKGGVVQRDFDHVQLLVTKGKQQETIQLSKVDRKKILVRPGGALSVTSSLKLEKQELVQAEVDSSRKVKESNETNNLRREKLTPRCQFSGGSGASAVADRPSPEKGRRATQETPRNIATDPLFPLVKSERPGHIEPAVLTITGLELYENQVVVTLARSGKTPLKPDEAAKMRLELQSVAWQHRWLLTQIDPGLRQLNSNKGAVSFKTGVELNKPTAVVARLTGTKTGDVLARQTLFPDSTQAVASREPRQLPGIASIDHHQETQGIETGRDQATAALNQIDQDVLTFTGREIPDQTDLRRIDRGVYIHWPSGGFYTSGGTINARYQFRDSTQIPERIVMALGRGSEETLTLYEGRPHPLDNPEGDDDGFRTVIGVELPHGLEFGNYFIEIRGTTGSPMGRSDHFTIADPTPGNGNIKVRVHRQAATYVDLPDNAFRAGMPIEVECEFPKIIPERIHIFLRGVHTAGFILNRLIYDGPPSPDNLSAVVLPADRTGIGLYVHVVAVKKPNLYGNSETFTVVKNAPSDLDYDRPAALQILKPRGGEIWSRGSIQDIRWSQPMGTGPAMVSIMKGNNPVHVIRTTPEPVDPVANIFGVTFFVPEDLAPGDDYKIRIIEHTRSALPVENATPFTISDDELRVWTLSDSSCGGHSGSLGNRITVPSENSILISSRSGFSGPVTVLLRRGSTFTILRERIDLTLAGHSHRCIDWATRDTLATHGHSSEDWRIQVVSSTNHSVILGETGAIRFAPARLNFVNFPNPRYHRSGVGHLDITWRSNQLHQLGNILVELVYPDYRVVLLRNQPGAPYSVYEAFYRWNIADPTGPDFESSGSIGHEFTPTSITGRFRIRITARDFPFISAESDFFYLED